MQRWNKTCHNKRKAPSRKDGRNSEKEPHGILWWFISNNRDTRFTFTYLINPTCLQISFTAFSFLSLSPMWMSFRSSAEIGVVKIFFPSFISTIRNFVQQNLGGAFLYASLLRNMPELIGLPIVPPIEQEIGLIWKKANMLMKTMILPQKVATGTAYACLRPMEIPCERR